MVFFILFTLFDLNVAVSDVTNGLLKLDFIFTSAEAANGGTSHVTSGVLIVAIFVLFAIHADKKFSKSHLRPFFESVQRSDFGKPHEISLRQHEIGFGFVVAANLLEIVCC
jgi:hypothetical protein